MNFKLYNTQFNYIFKNVRTVKRSIQISYIILPTKRKYCEEVYTDCSA